MSSEAKSESQPQGGTHEPGSYDDVFAAVGALFDEFSDGFDEFSDGSDGDRVDVARVRVLAGVAVLVPRAIHGADLIDRPLPADLNVRVLATVRHAAATSSSTPIGSAHPAESISTAVVATTSPGPRRGRLRRFRRRIAFGLAAVIAAVVATLTSLPNGAGPVVALSVVLAPAIDSPSPGAAGQADFLKTGSGSAVKVSLQGLAPNKPDEYYECWLVGNGDSPETPNRISIGTFRTKTGDVAFDWPAASYAKTYSRVDISLEPDDGDPGFGGVLVLNTATDVNLVY